MFHRPLSVVKGPPSMVKGVLVTITQIKRVNDSRD